ncbi:MAG: sodium:solute symporter family protein [Methanothrix sp.]|jgi:Na+/panthothenate symporter|uniref:Na+/solute symporter n=1 Tax=Methanothrix thermoacetophila (strain DSM 6194 / JCM 14653 / NBRC 101360 / PT) TaxID=349307 RepID=A0B8N2_METTP|nr:MULTISPECIES: sodium:solute symporter family protein [Methanothrix]ABK15056.1 Na+/solute symporter [Methanothrix thermoacetophila PT]MBC7079362.1 sodium:solute symporter family protein [Methanothrix sp.]NPU86828.1 sodium:solute symporter family protein [Methanothrix sp.]
MINQILLLVYVTVILLLSWRFRQGTFSGFALSDRNIATPAIIGIAYTAAYFSAASFLGGGGYGLTAGMPWVVFCAFFHVAFACLAWLMAGRIWAAAKEYDAKTVPQLLERRYGSPLGKVILAAIMLVLYTVYLVPIFKGCATLLQGLIGVTYVQGLIFTVIIVAIYYAIGGLPAIIWIGFLQGVLMLGGAVLLYSSMLSTSGALEIWSRIPAYATSMSGIDIPWQKTLGMAFSISLGLLALPDLLIMIFSARDRRVVRFAGIYGPVSIAVYSICIFSLGILAYGVLSGEQISSFIKNPDSLVPFLARTYLPPGFDALVLLAAISAAMSTISAIVLVTTTSLTSDILHYMRPGISDATVLRLTRLVGVVILATAAVSAIRVPSQIVPLVSISMGVIACCVFVPLVFGLYWRRGNSVGFVASLLASFISIVIWNFYGNALVHPVFVGLICGGAAYITGSLFTSGLGTPNPDTLKS